MTQSIDIDQERQRLSAENDRLRSALLAQREADEANESRAGYDQWQALQDRATELRNAALDHQQRPDASK